VYALLHLSSLADDAPLTWWRGYDPVVKGDLDQAAEALVGQPLLLLLPAEAASHHRIDVPHRSGRWLRQAIHSVLEEKLLDDLDQLHLAQGPLLLRRHCRLWVVRRDWLQALLARLADKGLVPTRIHIDADCIPGEQPTALYCADRWLLGGGAEHPSALVEEELESLAPLLPDDLKRCADSPWPLLAEGAQYAIDLRQGEFALGSRRRLPWRALAVLVALGCGASLAQDIGHRLVLEQRSAELHQVNLATWQQRVPDESRVIDLKRQVQARLQQDQTPHQDLARRLETLAQNWRNSGGAVARVDHLDYLQGEGWTLRVIAPAFADLERLREGLGRAGLAVQADSTARDGQVVSARLQIKE
jgi:general secretion pathway protein L